MVNVRYGISFISEEQAEKNLKREIEDYDIARLAEQGRDVWNTALGKIEIDGGSEDEKSVFYTSLYRVFERPVCISEDGNYFSAFDGKVHGDDGTPFIPMTGFGILTALHIHCVYFLMKQLKKTL